MMKYLIVGKNGYIAQRFINSGINNITCTTSQLDDSENLYLDLKAPKEFDYSCIDKDTTIILLAAISSPDMCLNDYNNSYLVNVIGTRYFIEEALNNGGKVLFFSSDAVYGETESVVTEKESPNPLGSYAEMKVEIEQQFLGSEKFKVVRLSYVLSKNDKYMQYLTNCIKNNVAAEVFAPLDRSVIYIQDVVDAIVSISRNWEALKPSIINLAGKNLCSRQNIAEFINENFNNILKYKVISPNSAFYKARPWVINMKSLYLDDLLGRPPTNIKTAIKLELDGVL